MLQPLYSIICKGFYILGFEPFYKKSDAITELRSLKKSARMTAKNGKQYAVDVIDLDGKTTYVHALSKDFKLIVLLPMFEPVVDKKEPKNI